jgi:hypothetical protein
MKTISVENDVPIATRRVSNAGGAKELVIEPGRTEKNYWSDLWRFRELFYILAWRDISVRYKQTAIGVIWAILRAFLAMSDRQDAIQWRPLSNPGLRRNVAMAVFCQLTLRSEQ